VQGQWTAAVGHPFLHVLSPKEKTSCAPNIGWSLFVLDTLSFIHVVKRSCEIEKKNTTAMKRRTNRKKKKKNEHELYKLKQKKK
jgi:hypothetical protein